MDRRNIVFVFRFAAMCALAGGAIGGLKTFLFHLHVLPDWKRLLVGSFMTALSAGACWAVFGALVGVYVAFRSKRMPDEGSRVTRVTKGPGPDAVTVYIASTESDRVSAMRTR